MPGERRRSVETPGRPPSGRWRDDAGAQLLEFALALPILLALLVGIVTAGAAFDTKLSMNNAVREGARYGATLPVDTSMGTWLNRVADVTIAAGTGYLEDGDSGRVLCVAYVYPDGGGATDRTARIVVAPDGSRATAFGAQCFADGRPDNERRVQVEGKRTANLVAIFFTTGLDLEARGVARFERIPQP